MKKIFAQITLLFLLLAFCVMAVVLVRQVLQLPFGPTNDNFHNFRKKNRQNIKG